MANFSRFLAFGVQLSVCRALVCSKPFKDVLGVCLYFPNVTMTWCGAQYHCYSRRGELVRGTSFLSLNGKNFSGMPADYWIGLTDYASERNTNRDGWQWSDGSLDPSSSDLAWMSGHPKNSSHDCVHQCAASGRLCSATCTSQATPVCQQISQRSLVLDFKSVSIPVGLPANNFAEEAACSGLVKRVETLMDCFVLCKLKKYCVAIYYFKKNKYCRLVHYTNAAIKIRNAQGWKKFVMKK